MHETHFKSCCKCHTSWERCDDFIRDRDLQLNGYQASFDDPDNGIFLLTHRADGCGTTLAIAAGRFKALYGGPTHQGRRTGLPDCEGLCLDEGRLEACEADCDLAWIRRVLQYLRKHELPASESHCTSAARCDIVTATE